MSTNEPVAWANFRHDPPSYIPYRTEAEAKASVERSEIAATQDGPFSVEPLVLQSDLAAAQKRIAEMENSLRNLRAGLRPDVECAPWVIARLDRILTGETR